MQADQQSYAAAGPLDPGILDQGNTPLDLNWSEFMVPGDLDFLNTFGVNTFAL